MTLEMKKCRKMICLTVLALMTGEKVARGGEIVCATLARVREREKEAAAKERNVKDLLQSLFWAAHWEAGERQWWWSIVQLRLSPVCNSKTYLPASLEALHRIVRYAAGKVVGCSHLLFTSSIGLRWVFICWWSELLLGGGGEVERAQLYLLPSGEPPLIGRRGGATSTSNQ